MITLAADVAANCPSDMKYVAEAIQGLGAFFFFGVLAWLVFR